MIININKIKEELENKEFDLEKAIRDDEVDLIFGESEGVDESYTYNKKENMKMLIRNKEEDSIGHGFSMKFIPKGSRKDDKYFNHDGRYGLPISFTRQNKDWKVDFGPGKKSMNDAKAATDILSRKEKKFITSVVDNIGDDI